MDPNIFRKGDASSCLVVDKPWADVLNKPDFFEELANRLVLMYEGAEGADPITKAMTLGKLKKVINQVLLSPLIDDVPAGADTPSYRTLGAPLADAFWDEIEISESFWSDLKVAVERAYAIQKQVAEHQPLTSKNTLQETKDNFKETIVDPLLGKNQEE